MALEWRRVDGACAGVGNRAHVAVQGAQCGLRRVRLGSAGSRWRRVGGESGERCGGSGQWGRDDVGGGLGEKKASVL